MDYILNFRIIIQDQQRNTLKQANEEFNTIIYNNSIWLLKRGIRKEYNIKQ